MKTTVIQLFKRRQRKCRDTFTTCFLALGYLLLSSSLFAQSACPTIVNTTQTAVTVCTGHTVDSLQLGTSIVDHYKIAFYRFDAPQSNPYKSHDGVFLNESIPANGLATIRTVSFPPNDGTTDKTYYVYGCLKPEPADTTCRPFALITVIIRPNPAFTITAREATCHETTSAADGSVTLAGFKPDSRYEITSNGSFSGQGRPIPGNGVVLSNLSRTGTTTVYEVRVYSTPGCYAEKTVTLMNTACTCPPDRCIPFVIHKITARR